MASLVLDFRKFQLKVRSQYGMVVAVVVKFVLVFLSLLIICFLSTTTKCALDLLPGIK